MTMTMTRNGQRENLQPQAPEAAGKSSRFELQARTPAGAHLVRLAEQKAAEFSKRAAEHDREASYPFEAIDALKLAGYFVAPIPEQLGGLGVESVHDLVVASSRLARGDPSVAIGVNMHLSVVGNMARKWRMAAAGGNEKRLAHAARAIEEVVQKRMVIATAVSEPGQDLTWPSAIAIRTDSGWRISGRKIFCTMSPAADLLYVTVSFVDSDDQYLYGYARIPKDAPGVIVHNDWDALGMRASGSHSLTLDNVEVPASALPGGFRAGSLTAGYMEGNLTAGLLHASSSLGIAEAASACVMEMLAKKRSGSERERPRDIVLAAEAYADLSAMRALISRTGSLIDDYYADHPASDGRVEEITAIFTEVQTAKTFINEAAMRVVDRALALSGGAGYMAKHPLSRAYRDVRAGAFMHPLGANRAYEFIGQVALGLEPSLS
jgi:alkylation response protein AidB-like acyl-CoA dehydrogenase